MTDAKNQAKRIIAEIIRQAGGELHNKTNLYKAFYHAHLKFADSQPGYLSTWPIVKMPNGPGIDRADALLGEMTSEGVLRIKQVKKGGRYAFVFRLSDAAEQGGDLSPEAVSAISEAVKMVLGKSAASVSHESHIHSRAWREAKVGDKLMIYCDSLPNDEYEARRHGIERIAAAVDLVWNVQRRRP